MYGRNPFSLNVLRGPNRVRGAVIAAFAVACLLLAVPSLWANAGPMGVNGDWDWVNVVNGFNGQWCVPATCNTTGALTGVDTNGWPTGDAGMVLFDQRKDMPWDGPDPQGVNEDFAGTYNFSFTGQATISGTWDGSGAGLTVQNQSYNSATNQTTGQLVFAPGSNIFEVQFTNTKRLPGDNPGDGFTKLVILVPGESLGTSDIFTPETLNIGYKNDPYASVRLGNVDAMTSYQTYCTATTLCTTYWANRVLPTQAWQNGTGLAQNEAPTSQSYGAAWEYMIEFANQTNQDIWIHVPISADDNYVTSLATLLLDGDTVNGVTYPGLNSNRNVYVEYSNEVWNSGFHEYTWNAITAENAGLTPIEQYVTRSIQIAKIFQGVFGDSGNPNGRVRPVIEWQVKDQIDMFDTLQWWEQTNSDLIKHYVYGVGDAPYVEPRDTSAINPTINSMWTSSDPFSIDGSRQDTLTWRAVASYFGVNLTGYESGPSSLSSVNMGAVLRDHGGMPGIFQQFYLNNWFAVGGDLINYFQMRTFAAPYDYYMLSEDYDHWGFEEQSDYSYLGGIAPPAVDAGFILPWAANPTAVIDPSQYATLPFSAEPAPGSAVTMIPGGTNPFLYLLRTLTTGNETFNLTLYGRAQNSSAYVDVYVDDVKQGTLQLPLTTGLSTAVSILVPYNSPPHQHTLQLVPTGAQSYLLAGSGAINLTFVSGGGTAEVPSAPMNLTAASGNNQVTLEWATTSTATAYNVMRAIGSPANAYTQLAQVATNTYTDTTPVNGYYYYYAIEAVNSQGTSAFSPSVAVFPAPATAPATPTGVSVSSNGGDRTGIAIVSWNPVAGAMGYNVYRGVNGGALSKVTPHPGANNQYTDLNISNGSTYSYAVTAVVPAGESAQSSTASTGTITERVMSAPAELAVTTDNQLVFLSWLGDPTTTPQFNTAFNVKRSTTSGGPYTTVVSTNTSNAYDLTAVPGTTYYYVVTQTNNAGESATSAQVSAAAERAGSTAYKEGSPTIPNHE